MSQVSTAVSTASSLDWNVAAAAAAVFMGTLLTTVYGWFRGKKKLDVRLGGDDAPAVTSVVVQDNQTLREMTLVNREVRDQLLLTNHAISNLCKAIEGNSGAMEDILHELKVILRRIDEAT